MAEPCASILIVDDTPANISVLTGLLKDSYKTKVATNGEKALALAGQADKPDLILLDVMMPGMDGYEVCRRLKNNPITRDIPVIFVTAATEVGDEAKGFDVGAVDYIQKPFSPPLVLARVRTHLALRGALQESQEAKQRADALLYALLPRPAAEEIQTIGTVIPRRHENVAVLFCDIANFTAYCDRHEPEEVVAHLDSLFMTFEQVAAAHGLEKIKTVGDAFMGAAGLLQDVDDPLDAAVRCGLDMVSAAIDRQLGWTVRVGIHYGPVVAGIVGQERYQFDIWGDTVNVAARMANQGKPGSVVLTSDAWRHLVDRFTGRSLGEIDIKGKGFLSVFEVLEPVGAHHTEATCKAQD